MTNSNVGVIVTFGKNLIHIRTVSGWDRPTFNKLLSGRLNLDERRALRAHIKNAEDREQKHSVLVVPFSRLFGIPVRALTTEDLSGFGLAELRQRFEYEPLAVIERATDFRLGDDADIL
jgi:hypothetical protein